MNKKDIQYLKHIIDEIDFLSARCENLTLQDLMDDDVLQRASVRSLEVIGEAVKNLSEDYKKRHPSLEWKKIAGFRDILIHHYFGIDWGLIWDVLEHKLPLLEKVIETSIKERTEEVKRIHKTRIAMQTTPLKPSAPMQYDLLTAFSCGITQFGTLTTGTHGPGLGSCFEHIPHVAGMPHIPCPTLRHAMVGKNKLIISTERKGMYMTTERHGTPSRVHRNKGASPNRRRDHACGNVLLQQ